MSDIDRRDFLKTGAGAAAVAAFQAKSVMGANDRVRVAVVGLRGRGLNHIKSIHNTPNVELAAICDVDENVLTQRLASIEKLGHAQAANLSAMCASCSRTNPSTRSPSPLPITGIR